METSQAQPNPDLIIVTMTKSVAEKTTMALSPLEYIEVQRDAVKWATAALAEAAATIASQKSAMAAMEQVNQQQVTKLREAMEVIAEQSRRIKLLEGTPQPFEPVPPAPPVVPVTPSIANELAVTIVDNGNYGTELMTRLRGYVEKIDKSDVRRVILFQNKQQLITDKFPQVLLDKGLQWDADTMWSVWRTTTPPERAAYLEMAEKLKVTAYHFDDAQNNTPEELADAVRFMRGYTDKPIYASFRADDTKVMPDGKRVSFDMKAYKDAGLLITRQFFRQTEPVSVVDTWLKSGRILDGVNLEAFKEGIVTTTPADFEAMFNKCLAAGVPFLSVYTVVESAKWQMWEHAAPLWAKVNAMAVKMREARLVKA